MSKNIYTILIDLKDTKLYPVLRMLSFIFTQSPYPPFFPHFFCLSNIFMYTFIILCNLLSFSYLCI